jgi:hypothetical protein
MGVDGLMKQYVADFETTTTKEKTRIWAYGYCEIGNVENFNYGITMEDFISWCKTENKIVYFHNLKFDGEFIFYWLLTNGFAYSPNKESNTFNCLVSDMGQFYQIEIIFEKKNKRYKKVVFQDSLKKLPFPVRKIAKDFKLPIAKVEVEGDFYDRERPEGHNLTDDEILYLKHDVQVVAMALGIQFDQDLTKMTVGADSLHSFKNVIGKKEFERKFPVLPFPVDNQIRQAYRGGFTYLKEVHAGWDIETGIVFDVNSLYPSVMYSKPLPYGSPLAFIGKYEHDEFYPLYIQQITCEFEVKKDHIPTIQIKHGGRYTSTEYLKTSTDKLGNREVTLVLTNVDLDLFFEHYDVIIHEYHGGWKFKQATGLFCDYIDHWTKIKVDNAAEKNALYTLAKLMLNSLYGKFATNPDVTGKYPYLNDQGAISYKSGDPELRDPIYTGMGAFVTAWARDKTIRAAQKEYDRFIYADTDSIHLLGAEVPDIEIHNSRLGAWGYEGMFKRARFLRAKTYIEDMCYKTDEKGKTIPVNRLEETEFSEMHVTCAGMPDNVKAYVTWENFKTLNKEMLMPCRDGFWHGKLQPSHVPGGVVLIPTTFTIT